MNSLFRFDDKMNFDFHAPRRVAVNMHASLAEIRQAELIRQLAESEPAYVFKHALVQDTAYGSLMKHERKRLHRHVAETLEQVPNLPDESVGLLVHHFAQAGDYAKTYEYAMGVGEQAARVYANTEARAHYLIALDALARLPDAVENRRHRIDVLLRYVHLSASAEATAQSLQRLADAQALAETLPRDGNADPDSLRRARIHYYVGLVRVMRNELPEAISEFEHVLPLAQALGDQEMIVVPSNFVGRLLFAQGHFARAQTLFAQAQTPLERSGNWTEWILTTGFLGDCLSARGEYAAGQVEVERALARAHVENSVSGLAVVHVFMAFHRLMGGEWKLARAAAQKAIEFAEESGDRFFRYVGLNFRCWAETNLSDYDEAMATWTKTIESGAQLGGALLGGDWLAAMRVFIALGLGNLPEACQLAEHAVSLSRGVGGIMAEGLAQRGWALALAGTRHAMSDADQHFAASLRLLDLGDARLEAARTRLAWGQVLAARGEAQAAREQFEAAGEQFAQSGLTFSDSSAEIQEPRIWVQS